MCGVRFQTAHTRLTTFMKVEIQCSLKIYTFVNYFFTDFFLSTELIPKIRLEKWINRTGFGIRKTLILKWIFLGNVLTMAYKSTLLSTLVTIRYNKPIDTLADLDSSGLPFLLAKGSTNIKWFENDQRPIMKNIYNTSIVVEYTQETEAKYAQM